LAIANPPCSAVSLR